MSNTDKMRFETRDLTAENRKKLAELFPGVVVEGKVNIDLLRAYVGEEIFKDEAYEFTWVGKRASIAEAGKPIRKTLRPVIEDETTPTGEDSAGKPYCSSGSRNWDTTENLYIEGDNLEVLKLLQESYLGKIKMIYIDPPYNTGNDFIYRDDFAMTRKEYYEQLDLLDEDGNRLFKNTETNGRFHSDWCSMMYPRLVLARNLLSSDGVLFLSIDDNEVHNARKILDEIMGEANFITQFVWSAGRKNDSKLVSVSHEYILCYVKSKSYLQEKQITWRQKKQGLDDIYAIYEKLKKKYGDAYADIQRDLKAWYKSLPDNHPAKYHSHYSCVDERGIYFAADISWPGGGGPRYDVIHPKTGKPVKIPSRGWMFGSQERMQQAIEENRVHFGEDEKTVPCFKSYLKDHEFSAPYSVFYRDGRAATKRLRNLLGRDIFDNPKDEGIIKGLVEFIGNKEGIILDFFSGSATTAHAVMQLNAEDGGKRKFIMVQLPEVCAEGTEAAKAGYRNICEIGKERIRRAGDRIKAENKDKPGIENLDIGFRVFKLDSSNMNDVYYAPADYSQGMLAMMEDNIKADRTDLDLLFGCLLEWGLSLSLPHTWEEIEGCTVHTYNGGDLIACFDENVPESVVREIANRQPLRAVFRDSSFASSPGKINVFEIFKLLAPNTTVKVI